MNLFPIFTPPPSPMKFIIPTFLAVCCCQLSHAQTGRYVLDSHQFSYFQIGNLILFDWDLSGTVLNINADLTADWQGQITSPGVADSYYIRFDFVDPYQLGQLTAPDLNWGYFTGTLTNQRTNEVVERFYDSNGNIRIDWPNGFDAGFGVKRPEQQEWHPAPWTQGTAPDGSLEFGFWPVNQFGEHNGDMNVVLRKIPNIHPVPEPSSLLLAIAGSLCGVLRRRR